MWKSPCTRVSSRCSGIAAAQPRGQRVQIRRLAGLRVLPLRRPALELALGVRLVAGQIDQAGLVQIDGVDRRQGAGDRQADGVPGRLGDAVDDLLRGPAPGRRRTPSAPSARRPRSTRRTRAGPGRRSPATRSGCAPRGPRRAPRPSRWPSGGRRRIQRRSGRPLGVGDGVGQVRLPDADPGQRPAGGRARSLIRASQPETSPGSSFERRTGGRLSSRAGSAPILRHRPAPAAHRRR